jgi:dTDP-4-amino-4,6-dideoxygalactose transaminase
LNFEREGIMHIPILKIPFSDDDKDFVSEKVCEILSSGILTMGKYTREFEELFCQFTGAKYAVAVSNGTSALEIILRALEIEGKSVIVPTNTFLATAYAVMHAGNKVIFADSNPETLCLDADDIKRKITPDTAAVILVHVGGIITPDYYEVKKVCDDKGLYLVEDCAHAHGSSIDGRQAGVLGIAGAFSFFPTKVLVTGEGGMIVTNDETLCEKALMIRNHGKNPKMGNKMSEFGHNYRLSEITAILGVQQMKKAHWSIAERQRVAALYDRLLQGVRNVRPVELPSGIVSTYYKYIAYLSEEYDRDEVKKTMKERYNVSLTGEVYANLCHNEPLWDKYTYCGKLRGNSVACHRWPRCDCEVRQEGFPGAEYLSKHHICLPIYPGLKDEEIEYVVESLDKVLNKNYE